MAAPHAHATTSERRWDVGGVTRRGMRSVRRRLADVAHRRRLGATQRDERALARALIAALPATAVDHGPLVSIVILNRDGRDHLERCLRGLATTRYRDIEVIVVDNGSIDGSPELAETFPLPFPIRVIRNRTNRSFSEANAAGVAVATGELVCFLNNDIDPVHDDWLGYMVETLTSRGAAAVGARLIYPRHRGGARAPPGGAVVLPKQHHPPAPRRRARLRGRAPPAAGRGRRWRPPHLPSTPWRGAGPPGPPGPLAPARRGRIRSRSGRAACPRAGRRRGSIGAARRGGSGAARAHRGVPGGPARLVPRSRWFLAGVRLRHRRRGSLPQAAGRRRPTHLRRTRRALAPRIRDTCRRSGPLRGAGQGEPSGIRRPVGTADLS